SGKQLRTPSNRHVPPNAITKPPTHRRWIAARKIRAEHDRDKPRQTRRLTLSSRDRTPGSPANQKYENELQLVPRTDESTILTSTSVRRRRYGGSGFCPVEAARERPARW